MGLRRVLYQMALTCVAVNPKLKELYHYLKTRVVNPLKKMQALVVISKKLLTLLYTLAKKKRYYDPQKVFGEVRKTSSWQRKTVSLRHHDAGKGTGPGKIPPFAH